MIRLSLEQGDCALRQVVILFNPSAHLLMDPVKELATVAPVTGL